MKGNTKFSGVCWKYMQPLEGSLSRTWRALQPLYVYLPGGTCHVVLTLHVPVTPQEHLRDHHILVHLDAPPSLNSGPEVWFCHHISPGTCQGRALLCLSHGADT